MRISTIIYTLPLAAVLSLAAACSKGDAGGNDADGGTGSLTLTIGGVPETTLTRTAAEGNVMNLLSIWIVNRDSGKILVHEHLLQKGTSIGDEPSEVPSADETERSTVLDYVRFSEDGKSAEMRFVDISRGNCTLYAVANFQELDHGKYVVGAKIDDAFRDMLLSETELPDGESPAYSDTDGMPCSAAVDFSIGAGENHVSAELLRCVGRLTIAVRNNIAESSLFFSKIGLSAQNPTLSYVFRHDGGKIPGKSRNVNFRELDGMKRVDAVAQAGTEPVTIYDSYLYETTPDNPADFTFSLFGAVYRAGTKAEDVKIGLRREYNFDENVTENATVSDTFVLRSAASSGYYIGDVDGRPAYRFFSGDTELKHHKDIENFFWKFSSSTKGTITNVGTGRQLSLAGEAASMVDNGNGTTFTLKTGDKISGTGTGTVTGIGLRFLAPDGYSLAIGPDSGIYGSKDKDNSLETHWIFRKVETGAENTIPYFIDAEYEIPRVLRTMTYIDRYGNAQALNHIARNEHIYLTIGIFYNRELGQFDFQVEPWREKDSETTFD